MKITAFYEEFEDGSASTIKFESEFVPRVGDFIFLKDGVGSMRENADGSHARFWNFVVDSVSITIESGQAESVCITVRPITNV